MTEEYERDTENTGSASSSGTTSESVTRDSERRFSDTPQGSIDNIDDHMSEATKENETSGNNGSSSASSESSDRGKETYKLTRYGNIGVQPLGQEINVLRSSFIDVDMEIIDELKDLFLKVY